MISHEPLIIEKYDIYQLKELCFSDRLRVPEFQREFDWAKDRDRLRNLLISMIKNNPIGAFLFLKVDGENSDKIFASRKLIEIDAIEYQNIEDKYSQNNTTFSSFNKVVYYILDGQQRLGTLFSYYVGQITLLGKKGTRETAYYYLNARSLIEHSPVSLKYLHPDLGYSSKQFSGLNDADMIPILITSDIGDPLNENEETGLMLKKYSILDISQIVSYLYNIHNNTEDNKTSDKDLLLINTIITEFLTTDNWLKINEDIQYISSTIQRLISNILPQETANKTFNDFRKWSILLDFVQKRIYNPIEGNTNNKEILSRLEIANTKNLTKRQIRSLKQDISDNIFNSLDEIQIQKLLELYKSITKIAKNTISKAEFSSTGNDIKSLLELFDNVMFLFDIVDMQPIETKEKIVPLKKLIDIVKELNSKLFIRISNFGIDTYHVPWTENGLEELTKTTSDLLKRLDDIKINPHSNNQRDCHLSLLDALVNGNNTIWSKLYKKISSEKDDIDEWVKGNRNKHLLRTYVKEVIFQKIKQRFTILGFGPKNDAIKYITVPVMNINWHGLEIDDSSDENSDVIGKKLAALIEYFAVVNTLPWRLSIDDLLHARFLPQGINLRMTFDTWKKQYHSQTNKSQAFPLHIGEIFRFTLFDILKVAALHTFKNIDNSQILSKLSVEHLKPLIDKDTESSGVFPEILKKLETRAKNQWGVIKPKYLPFEGVKIPFLLLETVFYIKNNRSKKIKNIGLLDNDIDRLYWRLVFANKFQYALKPLFRLFSDFVDYITNWNSDNNLISIIDMHPFLKTKNILDDILSQLLPFTLGTSDEQNSPRIIENDRYIQNVILKGSKGLSKAIMNLYWVKYQNNKIVSCEPLDLYKNTSLGEGESIEQHHYYPEDWLEKQFDSLNISNSLNKKLRNLILNIVPLSSDSNNQYRSTPPGEYLYSGTAEDLDILISKMQTLLLLDPSKTPDQILIDALGENYSKYDKKTQLAKFMEKYYFLFLRDSQNVTTSNSDIFVFSLEGYFEFLKHRLHIFEKHIKTIIGDV